MAKRRRRRSPRAKKGRVSPQKPRLPVMMGLAVVVLGLLGWGVWQWQRSQTTPAVMASLSGDGLQVTSLDTAPADRASASALADEATSDLARYLGPATNPDGLIQAESGAAGKPSLVYFHADW